MKRWRLVMQVPRGQGNCESAKVQRLSVRQDQYFGITRDSVKGLVKGAPFVSVVNRQDLQQDWVREALIGRAGEETYHCL